MRASSVMPILLALGALTGCGSESSSPAGGVLVDFYGSACKKESGISGKSQQALTSADVYAGLQCVQWARSAAGVKVTLLNFEGACGAKWEGRVAQAGQEVELRLVNPSCMIASCGSCMYDWSFDLALSPADGDMSVRLVVDPCPGTQQPDVESVKLPLAAKASGEVCRYASYGGLGWQAMSLGTCGAAYMPCRGAANGMCGASDAGAQCDPELVCSDGGSAGEKVCHAPCKTVADCIPAGVMTCEQGVCRAPQSW